MMTMSEHDPVTWEAPPPKQRPGPRRTGGQWAPALERLRKYPGRWGRVIDAGTKEEVASAADTMRRNGAETTMRANGDGYWSLYACVPEGETSHANAP